MYAARAGDRALEKRKICRYDIILQMIDESWTWDNDLGVFIRPKLPRSCHKCGYQGYFNLERTFEMVPDLPPYFEVCPKCCFKIELKKDENPEMLFIASKMVLQIEEMTGMSIEELVNDAINRMIPQIDPKTGNVRFLDKITGEEIKFNRKNRK